MFIAYERFSIQFNAEKKLYIAEDSVKETFVNIAQQVANLNKSNSTSLPKINYFVDYENANGGSCELWGNRLTQEDRLSQNLIELPGTTNLLSMHWEEILLSTFKILQRKTIALSERQGSTACINIILENKIINANLGDSEAFLVRIDSTGKVTTTTLHESIHSPSQKQEQMRIMKVPNAILGKDKAGVIRVGMEGEVNALSVSGAIGDRFLGSAITHVPYIKTTTFELSLGEEAFVITACDGLREGYALQATSNKSVEQIIGDIVKLYKNTSAKNIAKQLALGSLNSGSQDNISVMVNPLSNHSKPRYHAVFDGHGGDQVSQMLSTCFDPTLHSKIMHKINKNDLLNFCNYFTLRIDDVYDSYKKEIAKIQILIPPVMSVPSYFQRFIAEKGIIRSVLSWLNIITQSEIDSAVDTCNNYDNQNVNWQTHMIKLKTFARQTLLNELTVIASQARLAITPNKPINKIILDLRKQIITMSNSRTSNNNNASKDATIEPFFEYSELNTLR